ncbi:MAG: Rieske 2Fe-2S domain-containing protein [Ardenticatenaceae bacterium]|nr:Rieske 2Fe-2S domain-containing protein [Ardenticatenaceae bacterium]MCB9445554.1 Rieske 2Fe-2S domain-containing protein [Ardenticatenaceae bacterium]
MPIFKKVKPDDDGFYTAVSSTAIPSNQPIKFEINGEPILLIRWQGELLAVSARCPHAAADLSKGEFYRGKIECPDHGYVFDVRNGRTLWPEDEVCRLKRFEVKEVDGVVKVRG